MENKIVINWFGGGLSNDKGKSRKKVCVIE